MQFSFGSFARILTSDYVLPLRGGEFTMDIFTSIVAPILVGIVLALFDHWLNHRDNDHK